MENSTETETFSAGLPAGSETGDRPSQAPEEPWRRRHRLFGDYLAGKLSAAFRDSPPEAGDIREPPARAHGADSLLRAIAAVLAAEKTALYLSVAAHEPVDDQAKGSPGGKAGGNGKRRGRPRAAARR